MTQLRIPPVYMRWVTSKVVLVAKSKRADCDIDYLFGAVSIESSISEYCRQSGDEPERQTPDGRLGAGFHLNRELIHT